MELKTQRAPREETQALGQSSSGDAPVPRLTKCMALTGVLTLRLISVRVSQFPHPQSGNNRGDDQDKPR